MINSQIVYSQNAFYKLLCDAQLLTFDVDTIYILSRLNVLIDNICEQPRKVRLIERELDELERHIHNLDHNQEVLQQNLMTLSIKLSAFASLIATYTNQFDEIKRDMKIPTLLEIVYSQEAFEDKKTCSVCLKDFISEEDLRKCPACQNLFHEDCIDTWLNGHDSCPLCRAAIRRTNPTKNNIK